jgi:hypothetical protein
LSQWGFGHSAINTLPVPGNACHLIVFSEAGTPDSNEETGMHPAHKMSMNSTRAAESLLWQRFPLAPSA